MSLRPALDERSRRLEGVAVPNFGTRRITTMPVDLRQGTNTIRFTASGASLELDFIELR